MIKLNNPWIIGKRVEIINNIDDSDESYVGMKGKVVGESEKYDIAVKLDNGDILCFYEEEVKLLRGV